MIAAQIKATIDLTQSTSQKQIVQVNREEGTIKISTDLLVQ